MKRLLLVVTALLGTLASAACSGRLDYTGSNASAGSGEDGGASSAEGGAGGSDQPGPYRITCSVYHRDVQAGQTEHARESIVFMTDTPAERTFELPGRGIPVQAKLAPAPDASDLVDLTLAFPRSGLKREIRLARDVRPPYELVGNHGFTGLNYVTTPGSNVDVQFLCEASARDEERPKPLPGPDAVGDGPPNPPPPSAPIRIRCELSTGESILLDRSTARSVTVGEHTIELELADDPTESRAFAVRAPGRVKQLYQLDRTRADVDVTRGPGGLTGRTVLESLSDASAESAASIACGAAKD